MKNKSQYYVWNKGLTKDSDSRIKATNGSFKKGNIPHNKGKTKENYEPLKRVSKNVSKTKKELFRLGILKPYGAFSRGRENYSVKYGVHNKGKTKENYLPTLEASKKLKGKKKSIEHINKLIKNHWSKKDIRNEVIAKCHTKKANENRFKSMMNTYYLNKINSVQTSFEKKFLELCIKYNLPFIYTGNRAFWLVCNDKHKNPDFICKDKKIAIEVFHSFYKKDIDKYKDYCKNIYYNNGWKVIFIDENILNSDNYEELCLNEINKKN